MKKRKAAWWVALILGALALGVFVARGQAPAPPYHLQAAADLPAPASQTITTPGDTTNTLVRLSIKPAQRQRFVEAMRGVLEPSRQAEGCLVFDVYQQRDDANAFVVYERWADAQAHQRHLATPYTAAFLAQLNGMLAQAPETLEPRDLVMP
ncbi:MAG: putative quinol monooxygenase [Pseudomonas sp.]|nr:putative quinol monooxygenase [Pseudomonas sp.]